MNDLSPISNYLCEAIDSAASHIEQIAPQLNDACNLIGQTLLSDNFFNIPAFQRDYVWNEGNVESYFNDIYESFDESKSEYYLGNIVLAKEEEVGSDNYCCNVEFYHGLINEFHGKVEDAYGSTADDKYNIIDLLSAWEEAKLTF